LCIIKLNTSHVSLQTKATHFSWKWNPTTEYPKPWEAAATSGDRRRGARRVFQWTRRGFVRTCDEEQRRQLGMSNSDVQRWLGMAENVRWRTQVKGESEEVVVNPKMTLCPLNKYKKPLSFGWFGPFIRTRWPGLWLTSLSESTKSNFKSNEFT